MYCVATFDIHFTVFIGTKVVSEADLGYKKSWQRGLVYHLGLSLESGW